MIHRFIKLLDLMQAQARALAIYKIESEIRNCNEKQTSLKY